MSLTHCNVSLSSPDQGDMSEVCSLCGVILIARPEFLFGRAAHDSLVVDVADDGVSAVAIVTPAQRLSAVGYVVTSQCCFRMFESHFISPSVALLGVCGATGACEYE